MATTKSKVDQRVVTTYPAEAVANALETELIALVRRATGRQSAAISKDDEAIINAVQEVDSLSVVEILCVLDDILPFQVGEQAVRAGGYRSIKEAVADVVERVGKEWITHQTGGRQ